MAKRKRSVGDVRRGGALRTLTPTRQYRSLEESTGIITGVVAETVVEELEVLTGEILPKATSYIELLALRADELFLKSPSFRKKISARGDKGRDTLYAFMRHWLAAMLKRSNPRIFNKLSHEYMVGRVS